MKSSEFILNSTQTKFSWDPIERIENKLSAIFIIHFLVSHFPNEFENDFLACAKQRSLFFICSSQKAYFIFSRNWILAGSGRFVWENDLKNRKYFHIWWISHDSAWTIFLPLDQFHFLCRLSLDSFFCDRSEPRGWRHCFWFTNHSDRLKL